MLGRSARGRNQCRERAAKLGCTGDVLVGSLARGRGLEQHRRDSGREIVQIVKGLKGGHG